VGFDVREQVQIDHKLCELDGTSNKEKLGANAILGVSLACARAASASHRNPLVRYIGGAQASLLPSLDEHPQRGCHADNNVDIQEFMVAPVGATSFREGLRMGTEVYHALKKTLAEKGYPHLDRGRGRVCPDLKSNEEALDLIVAAIGRAGYTPGKDVLIASTLRRALSHRGDHYYLEAEPQPRMSSGDLVAFWKQLVIGTHLLHRGRPGRERLGRLGRR